MQTYAFAAWSPRNLYIRERADRKHGRVSERWSQSGVDVSDRYSAPSAAGVRLVGE